MLAPARRVSIIRGVSTALAMTTTKNEIVDRFDGMFAGVAGESVEVRLSDFNPSLAIVMFSTEAGRDRVVRFHEEAAARYGISAKIRNVRGLEVRFDVALA